MTPKISMLMSNYNNARYIGEAIESVIGQTYQNWELVLLDDGSDDGSVKVIEKFLSDTRINFYSNKKNIGRINSLRRMIRLSKADIVGLLDSDDALSKDALAKIMDIYDNNRKVGMVYSQCFYCDENLKPEHLGFSFSIPPGKSNLHAHCVHHFRTFNKKYFLKTTGYNNEILTAEDFDIVLKLEEVAKLFFINKPLYYYRILPKSHSHGFKNTKINRSSTALAKLNAYERRVNTNISNLNKIEISEVLFFGIITALLAQRFNLALKFIIKIFKIHAWFLLDVRFYRQLVRKIKKIIVLKKEKPFLKI